jgi:hypothetical protein
LRVQSPPTCHTCADGARPRQPNPSVPPQVFAALLFLDTCRLLPSVRGHVPAGGVRDRRRRAQLHDECLQRGAARTRRHALHQRRLPGRRVCRWARGRAAPLPVREAGRGWGLAWARRVGAETDDCKPTPAPAPAKPITQTSAWASPARLRRSARAARATRRRGFAARHRCCRTARSATPAPARVECAQVGAGGGAPRRGPA